MSLKLKEITEDELESFLLSPFKRSARFNDKIIQKYASNDRIDEILVLESKRNYYYSVGMVCYNTEDIILSLPDVLETNKTKSKPFILKTTAIFKIMDLVNERLDEYKKHNMDELKNNETYLRLYHPIRNKYFESIVFQELGSTAVEFNIHSLTEHEIDMFLSRLRLEDLAEILSGEMKQVDALIDKITKSANFLETEIIYPEIINEAKEYVAKGVFTKREQLLIDYITKTKASGAQRFTVETTYGRSGSCRNEVNSQGKVFSIDGLRFLVDIVDIKKVTYNGKVIYNKSIL